MATIFSSPSTPSNRTNFIPFTRTPPKSSPLAGPADSSPPQSPTPARQQRRKSQFKSLGYDAPSFDFASSSRRRSTGTPSRSTAVPRPELSGSGAEAPGKAFLRERFKARCIERALKDRERKVSAKRRASDLSSDGPDEMMDWDDEEEEEDDLFNDDLIRRIMNSVNHKQQHSYRLSYAQEVGSSFDPDMEDMTEWEGELQAEGIADVPDDFDEQEIAAYAAEQELLDGLTPEELFSYSDIDDVPHIDRDVDMAM